VKYLDAVLAGLLCGDGCIAARFIHFTHNELEIELLKWEKQMCGTPTDITAVASATGTGSRIYCYIAALRYALILRTGPFLYHHSHALARALAVPAYAAILRDVQPYPLQLPLSDEDLIVWFFFFLGFWLAEGGVECCADPKHVSQRLDTTQKVDKELHKAFQSIFGGKINGTKYRIQTLACLYILLPVMMPLVESFPYNHAKLAKLHSHITRPV